MTRASPDPTFETLDGTPVPAVTTGEMREIDRVAVEAVGLDLLQMMENAGRTLAAFAREHTDGPVVVLAGDGGNGGGGLCAARHLANHGWKVQVGLDRASADLTGAAARQYRLLRETPARCEGTDVDALGFEDAGLVVDAIVGYGLTGAPRAAASARIEACNAASAPVVSLDVPSGVDATTGQRPGVAVDADDVVTLALPKTGLSASNLWLADIGIPQGVYERVGVDYSQPFSGASRVRLRTV